MKKLISAAVVFLSCCLFSVSAFASAPYIPEGYVPPDVDVSPYVFGMEDATLEVGDTWAFGWHNKEYGNLDKRIRDNDCIEMIDYYVTDDGDVTFVVQAVAPGTASLEMWDAKYVKMYMSATITVVGDAEEAAAAQNAPEKAVVPATAHSEIGEAIADGTWGAEYTTCPACGYHNWTASAEGYVCDTCGYITTSVKTGSGVRGYVNPLEGVKVAAVTASSAAPVTAADVAAAQAANDAYLAAIAELQTQVAQREAAYLAALNG